MKLILPTLLCIFATSCSKLPLGKSYVEHRHVGKSDLQTKIYGDSYKMPNYQIPMSQKHTHRQNYRLVPSK